MGKKLDLKKLETERKQIQDSANQAEQKNQLIKAIKGFWKAISVGDQIKDEIGE